MSCSQKAMAIDDAPFVGENKFEQVVAAGRFVSAAACVREIYGFPFLSSVINRVSLVTCQRDHSVSPSPLLACNVPLFNYHVETIIINHHQ
jgi:hypothetical protein